MYNALQPGVFALSGWDLCGLLPVPVDDVADLVREGDTRWINRGAHDLMGVNPEATRSESGIPRATSLYGTLPEQLRNPESFACKLSRIIEVRNRFGIATAVQIDVPTVSHKGLLVMVHQLADMSTQVTVLNFTSEEITATVQSQHLPAGASAYNLFTDELVGTVDELHSFPVTLHAYEGVPVILKGPRTGSSSAVRDRPIISSPAIALSAPASSTFSMANPMWITIQSPGSRCTSSSSMPMLTRRSSPTTSTRANWLP
jgi:trehalose synthase